MGSILKEERKAIYLKLMLMVWTSIVSKTPETS